MWKEIELRSPAILNSTLTSDEKDLIKLYILHAIRERKNFNQSKYYEGVATGIAQTLRMLGRNDIWELIEEEVSYHDELL